MIKQILYGLLPERIKQYRRLRNTSEYRILHSFELEIPSVYHIKDSTWEHVHMPEIYGLMREWENQSFCPAQDIIELQEAVIRTSTDIITIGDGCLWDKADYDIFSKIVPLDKGLLSYNQEKVRVRKPRKIIDVAGYCISMLGVHEKVWTHFLVQFLPKMYYAEEAGLLDMNDVSIIMPNYTDANINELIGEVMSRHPNVTTIICDDDYHIAYRCEKLFYIPSPSVATNHANYILPYDAVIPQRVIDVLYNNIVLPRQILVKKKNNSPKKLYLVRRSTYRGLRNYQEIEDYFVSKGFILVEPHQLSLQQKAELFAHAEFIAGPASGAWTNVIFCKKSKALFLNTLCRTIDPYSKYLMQIGNVRALQVTGWDFSTNSIHSDFYISIDKIDAAYNQLIRETL